MANLFTLPTRVPIPRFDRLSLPRPSRLAAWVLVLCALPTLGCTTIRETQPPRTATEQFLLSQAMVQAVDDLDLKPLDGQSVFLDSQYIERIDRSFILGELRAALMESGATLAKSRDQAQVIVEARSAGVGINKAASILGLPALPIPVPTIGTIETPELALLKNRNQLGLADVAVLAYRRTDRGLVISTAPGRGRALMNDWSFLGLRFYRVRDNLPNDLE